MYAEAAEDERTSEWTAVYRSWRSLYLLDWTLGLKEDPSAQQLSKDAAHRPDIDGVVVVTAPHQDLWSSVVLGYDFLSHVAWLVGLLHSGESEVTDLKKTKKNNRNVFI